MRSMRAAPRPWIAYPPARPSHSPHATYHSSSASSIVRKVTSVVAVAAWTSPVARIRAIPLTTRWVRPESRRRVSAAAAAFGGLPQISSSVATTVSTPSTISPSPAPAATALRRAFSPATTSGAPSSSSTTSTGRSTNSTPSWRRIARRCGERLARTSVTAALLEVGEEQRRLARGRLVGVRPVDHVLADLEREVPADRAGRRLERVGGPDDLPGGHDGLVALEDHRHERPRGDELDQLAEERLALVLGVMTLGGVLGEDHVLEGHDAQPFALEAGDDLAGQAARERVRLDQDEGPVHWGGLLRVLLRRRFEGRRRLGLELELVRAARAPAAPAAAWRGRDARDLGLAVRADAPRRVQRLGAVHARVLELAHATRAAQELALDLGVAMRAQEVVQRVQPRLRRLHLELALAHVLEVLGRAHDHVDDRAHEREQGGRRRARDEHRIGDAPARVGIRVVDERQPHDHEDEDQQLDGRVEAVVGDAEEA